MAFVNQSSYIIPIWFDDFEKYTKQVSNDGRWKAQGKGYLGVRYLFRFIKDVVNEENYYQAFDFDETKIEGLNIYMHENELDMKSLPVISRISLSCFSTGVGFLEFWVNYGDWDIDEILDFSYKFKKAAKQEFDDQQLNEGQKFLYDAAMEIVPREQGDSIPILFCASSDPQKYETNCYHMVKLSRNGILGIGNDTFVADKLDHLKRSYGSEYKLNGATKDSRYEMRYDSSFGDWWGGCQEGLANLVCDNGVNPKMKHLINEEKRRHLEVDFHILYLLLLNQKYSSLCFINQIINKKYAVAEVNDKIIELKNIFSFRVISDDRIYQNVYIGMYKVLEIDNLLEDLQDIEQNMEMAQNKSIGDAENNVNAILTRIAMLSIFSALIDAACFFDRISGIPAQVATWISVLIIVVIFVLCVPFIKQYVTNNRRKSIDKKRGKL